MENGGRIGKRESDALAVAEIVAEVVGLSLYIFRK